jgi:glycosyltransferase involved in cell wall biosynthesis
MKLTKRILIVVPRAYLPQLTGGLEISAHEVSKVLIQQGFEVHVAAGDLSNRFAKNIKRLKRKAFGPYSSVSNIECVHVHRELWHPTGLLDLIDRLSPKAILFFTSGTDDVAAHIVTADRPTAIFMCGEKISKELGLQNTKGMKACQFVCDSSFIAERIKLLLDKEARVICPIMSKTKYLCSNNGNKILVVNPIPKKGGAIVLAIAKKMPHREFLIVGGWQHVANDEELNIIEEGLKLLKNVTRLPNTRDMRPIFSQTYCLLMPCIVREAFGRVAAEAQISGIPVVASSQGALPETVGEGGVTMHYQTSTDEWVSILNSLFEDHNLYSKLSHAATNMSNLPKRQDNYIYEQLRQLIGDLVDSDV